MGLSTMMDFSVSDCPVPAEQQPLNEYEALKTSNFFSTCSSEWRKYLTKLAWVWGFSWIIAGPVAAASFSPQKHIIQFMLCGAGLASAGVIFTVLRWYLGWSYVCDRLTSPTIFYEESGWYDGQTWTKPQEILTRDRLIVSYQVKPIIHRLQQTLAVIAIILVLGLFWYFL
jgi:hypothetical protein